MHNIRLRCSLLLPFCCVVTADVLSLLKTVFALAHDDTHSGEFGTDLKITNTVLKFTYLQTRRTALHMHWHVKCCARNNLWYHCGVSYDDL